MIIAMTLVLKLIPFNFHSQFQLRLFAADVSQHVSQQRHALVCLLTLGLEQLAFY
jgi:hypothetical protein